MRPNQQRKTKAQPTQRTLSANYIDRIQLDELLAKLIQSNEINCIRAEIDRILLTYTPQDDNRLRELSARLVSPS